MSKWNWQEQRERKAFLAFEDGTVFRGWSWGAPRDEVGEVVFNTGMSGYQEILTDPSYAGQIVTMTYPEIGNYGCCREDMESRKLFLNGFIVREMNCSSNFRAETELKDYLRANDVPALAGVDTRALTRKLREGGTQKAFLCATGNVPEEEAVQRAREWEGLDNQDYASRVTIDAAYDWDPDGTLSRPFGSPELPATDLQIVLYDFGVKWNILRCLRQHGMNVRVVPAQTPAEEVAALNPDGIFFSNGPADPAAVTYAIENARKLLGKFPIMGICLGCQLLGLATGGRTYRLKFGHHGINHPVKDLATGKVEITSQNHNFAIDPESVDSQNVEITHINLYDGTVEGIRHKHYPMFAVQYHPEAGPGPHDPYYLFARFRKMILEAKQVPA